MERQSASADFTWDITWTLCSAFNPTFYWPVRCTPVRCTTGQVYPMFWHDIVYIELLYCVTNFELVWTWNKVVVIENAKKCRVYPTFPYLHFSLKIFTLNISKTRANLKKLSAYSGSATSIYPKIDLTLHAKNFLLNSVVIRALTVSMVRSCFATN